MENEKKTSKTKTILRVVLDVIWGFFLVFITIFAITNVIAKKNEGIPNTFGTGYLAVSSGSMEGTYKDSFKVGDLITVTVVKDAEKQASDLKAGQIITYFGNVGGTRAYISHRIYAVDKDSTGATIAYYTLGDYYACDEKYASYTTLEQWQAAGHITRVGVNEVKAIYKGQVKGLGKVITWFQQPVGFFVLVVLPTFVFLIVELIQFIRALNEYRNTGKVVKTEEELAAEREALKAQLLAELRAEALKQAQASASEAPAITEAPVSEEKTEEK